MYLQMTVIVGLDAPTELRTSYSSVRSVVIFDTEIASMLFQKLRQLLKILGGAPGAKPGVLHMDHLSY
jgi:hypothetical protein